VKGKGKVDYLLLLLVLALVGFGIVMVYSTTAILAGDRFQDPYFFLKRQALYAGIGFVVMVFMMLFPYPVLRRFAYPILGFCVLSLIAVLIPGIGHRAGGHALDSDPWVLVPALRIL
jgi:cell division protein FtsW